MQSSLIQAKNAAEKMLSNQESALYKMLPDVLKQQIAAGQKEFYNIEYYFRKKLAYGAAVLSTGIIDLIKSSDDLKEGITNLQNGKILPGTAFIACGVSLAYGSATDATQGGTNVDKADMATYASSDYIASVPAQLRNADVVFKGADKKIFEGNARFMFTNANTEKALGSSDETVRVLSTPKVITEGKLLQISVKIPQNAPATSFAGATTNHYVEGAFHGILIADRTV